MFNFYAVYESHYFVDFSFGREDVGEFIIKPYCFKTIKSMLKQASHWSEKFIDNDVFVAEHTANKEAKQRTEEKVSKIKANLKTEEDFRKFKEVYPNEEI